VAEWDNGDKPTWVQFRQNERRNLDELYAGLCDGMTYKEIEKVYPEEFEARQVSVKMKRISLYSYYKTQKLTNLHSE